MESNKVEFFKTNHEALMYIIINKAECNLIEAAKTLNDKSIVKINGTTYLVDTLGLLD